MRLAELGDGQIDDWLLGSVLESKFEVHSNKPVLEQRLEMPQTQQQLERQCISLLNLANKTIGQRFDLLLPLLGVEPQPFKFRRLHFCESADYESGLTESSQLLLFEFAAEFNLLKLAHLAELLALDSEQDKRLSCSAVELVEVVPHKLCLGQ